MSWRPYRRAMSESPQRGSAIFPKSSYLMAERNLPAPWAGQRQALKGGVAQTQRVDDHADRAEAHGGACDHRIEQQTESRVEDTGGDRYGERVEDERKEQILTDV